MRVPFFLHLLCLAALATAAHAQGIRPGGSARGATTGRGGIARPGGATGAGTANRGGTGASASGPRQYRSNTQLGDAIIQIDPETKSVIIVTDEDTHREMVNVIRELDKPKPQVLIKVVFLEVTYNKGYDVGVEGGYTVNLKNPFTSPANTSTTVTNTPGTSPSSSTTTINSNGSTVTNTFPVNTTTVSNTNLANQLAAGTTLGTSFANGSNFGLAAAQAAGLPGFYGRVISDDYNATVKLLATRGKVEVLSRPSIMARNNQEAVIVVGQEVPFITNSRVTDLGQTINTIQYDNVGIILRVTPFITSDNMVEMIVAPEISQLTAQTVAISNTVSSPVISKRSAETVVVTPNGSTAVIGGLMQTQRVTNIDKIPILGDIPGLGVLFRHTKRDDVKTELMIFLTPTIVFNPNTVGDLTGKELQNTELVEKAFSEKEFDKFFDGQDKRFAPSAEIPAHENPAPRKVQEIEKTKEREPIKSSTLKPLAASTPVKSVKKKVETTTTVVVKPTPTPARRP
jgi:type II secretion system protein D